ncbi:MAG: response regulator [Bacteroidota bacterium]
MVNCLLVDDEPYARELIQAHLAQLPDFRLVAACGSALEAMRVLQKETIDLLFLDIEMPLLKGTDFLAQLIQKPQVIFTTAYREYAWEGFELNAVDYLLKPITFARFMRAIEKYQVTAKAPVLAATKPPTPQPKEFIFVRENRKEVRILLQEIRYVKSIKDYVGLHTDVATHLVKSTLEGMQQRLDGRFLRIHRSYLVNTDYVTAYTTQDVELGKVEIPIGENYKAEVRQYFQKPS